MFVARLARSIAPVVETTISSGTKFTKEVAKSVVEDEFKAKLGVSHVQTGRASAGGAVASLLRAQVGANAKANGAALAGNAGAKVWATRLDQSVISQSNTRAKSPFTGDTNLSAANLLLRPRRIPL